jgi:hypothetical protein
VQRAAAGIIRRAFRAKTFETLCCLKLKRLGCWRVYMQVVCSSALHTHSSVD